MNFYFDNPADARVLAAVDAAYAPWELVYRHNLTGEWEPAEPLLADDLPLMATSLQDARALALANVAHLLKCLLLLKIAAEEKGADTRGWRMWVSARSEKHTELVDLLPVHEEGVSDQRPEPANDND